MSTWFLPEPLNDEACDTALENAELALPAAGLGDLSKVEGPYQIADWMRRLNPQATPERIALESQHYWRLAHDVLLEDTLIVRRGEKSFMIGEVSGTYRREEREGGPRHIWPVDWRDEELPAERLPTLINGGHKGLTEVTDEHAIKALGTYVPALRKGNARIFRWVAIGTLIFELIYFWPHS